jgi:WD40 repeat protein
VWNRLRRSGWPAAELDEQLRGVDDAGFLHVRHAMTRESPALVRDLVGHTNRVRACAVTPDGRRVVSASADETLKVWDLETGHLLATLEGHAYGVWACAVTPDGGRVVSASADHTLKVWDLKTYTCLVTHRGDPPYVAVATSTTAIVAGDSVGGLWILDWPPSPTRL